MSSTDTFAANIDRFTGFAALYDRHRAGPPAGLAPLVAQFAGGVRPGLVVDLGSGTGLSTRYWADKAERVIGVEPTPDMRAQAVAATTAANISYLEGLSHATGLPGRSAQIVCCVQSLHWMEPRGTFEEAARILVRGGVFATCDYDWPPVTASWEANAAFESSQRTARRLEREMRSGEGLRQWDKAGHLTRMEASGCFRHVQEAMVHHTDEGNADRLVGLLLSQGYVQDILKRGVTETELGIDTLRHTALHTLGAAPRPFFWGARVRVGVV
jgi:SAM-dependent methyltransferase